MSLALVVAAISGGRFVVGFGRQVFLSVFEEVPHVYHEVFEVAMEVKLDRLDIPVQEAPRDGAVLFQHPVARAFAAGRQVAGAPEPRRCTQ